MASGLEERTSGLEERRSGLEERRSGLKQRTCGLEERTSRFTIKNEQFKYSIGHTEDEQNKGGSRHGGVAIAAIDFGTTYSSYAYTFEDYLQKARETRDMCKVLSNTWQSGSDGNLISNKTPTSLLLNPKGEFDSFGFKAEENYNNLANDNAHAGWKFFRRFKMVLHNNKVLNEETTLTDDQGNPLRAITVFAHCIRFMKDELMKKLDKTGCDIHEHEVKWVITIPAIWDPASKQFMRKAAEEAGIEGPQLEFALEPEAAAVYIKEMLISKAQHTPDETELVPFPPGTQFMVLDLGGGTVDITVKEVRDDRTLRELHRATGNDMGGESINRRVMKYLEELLGKDVIDEFRTQNEHKAALLDLETEIEQKKRNLKFDQNEFLKLNLSSITDIFEKKSGKALDQHVKTTGGTRCKRGKLSIPKDKVAALFEPSVSSIVELVKSILSRSHLTCLSEVIMVGGFSQCSIISSTIKKEFEELNVVVPNEPDLAVLKGAVLYRKWPEVIHSRRSQFTLGSRFLRAFINGYDDESKRIKAKGGDLCGDIFSKFVTIDQEFKTTDKAELEVNPMRADTTKIPVRIYKSLSDDPKYVTDKGCTQLGPEMIIDIPDTTGGIDRKVIVTMTMGNTEITVEGKQEPGGKVAQIKFDLLNN